MKQKSKIQEGDVFAVPTLGDSTLKGVIARLDGHGLVLAYFFRGMVPLAPERAIFICRVDHRALTGAGVRPGRGDPRWPLIGRVDGFARPAWPVPQFHNPFADKVVTYDDDARGWIEERRAAPGDEHLPHDGYFGWLAAEDWLRKKLSQGAFAAA